MPPGVRLSPHVKRLLLQARNGSVEALQSLAPEVQEDVDLLIELMPMILLNIPNKTHPLLCSTPDPNQAPDKTTRLGYTALHVLLRGLNGYRFADGDASELKFMQRWPDIFAWCSFLSVNYLERPTYFLDQGDDFKEELQLTITMLLWLLTLPASGVVLIVTTTPGCISLIARLYLLAARMSLTTEESLLFAGRALQNLLQLPQSAWDPEFTNELDKTHPSVVNDILYRVIKDTERRPMNCPALKGGFIILSNICRSPVLNRLLIRKDAVYWICRAIHKLVVNPAMVEKENIKMATGTIKMGCHYLLEAISQQGYECVVQAVNFRLLSSMLRSTAMVEDDLTTENPNPPHPLFTIYGRLLKGIASHTMYRSVLSALERALDRIKTQLLDHLVVSSPFSDSWFSFVNVIEDRIEVKVHWDSHFVNICSYFDCPESDNCSDPERRWSICSACRIFYYCGRRCQIADWERHRIVCASMARQRKMGHNVPLDTRTEMFLGWIIQRDIRVDREKFLRARKEYRAARRSSGSKPLSSTIDEEVLVTRLDYRTVPVASTVVTIEEARREYELHCQWFGGDPEKVPRLLKEAREKKRTELPLTMVLYPYGLLTGAWIGFGVLKVP